jgi:hypothetical protein
VVPRVNMLIKSLVPDERQGWGIILFYTEGIACVANLPAENSR